METVIFVICRGMDRYFGFAKYPVLILALLPMGGHLFCCAHCHSCCEQTHHDASEYLQPVHCCQETPYKHKHECNGNSQPVIVSRRSGDESVKPFWISFTGLSAFIPVLCEPALVNDPHVIPLSPSALPVRLHLLYRSLLI